MASDPQANEHHPSRTRRRHGYRGYGSPLARVRDEHGSDFQWGLGFGGGAGVLPHASLISEDLRESLSREESRKKS